MALKRVPVTRGEAQVRDRIPQAARPVTARNDGLTEAATDLVPTHLAVPAVSVTRSHATDVPATPDRTTSAATGTDGPVPMLDPVVTANLTVMPVRRTLAATAVLWALVHEVKSDTLRMTGTVGTVPHVTVPTVLPTPDASRDLKARNVRLDAPVVRVPADDLRLALTVVTRVMGVTRAPTLTDDPALHRAGHEAARATVRAIHRVGAARRGPPASSPRKK